MQLTRRNLIVTTAAASACAVVLGISACSSEKAAAKKKVTATTGDVTAAFPGELALTAFPQSTATSTQLDGTEPAPEKMTIKEKVEEAKEILEGKVDDCVPAALKQAMRTMQTETCYEFDHDMVKTTMNSTSLGTLNGKNTAGEACLVAFARSKIDQAVDIVDRSTGMVATMICQAKKKNDELGLPKKVGTKLDLKKALDTAFEGQVATKGKMEISAAYIERLDDSNDARPVFKSHIEMTDNFTGATREVNIVHSPKSAEDNTEFRGTLWTKVTMTNPNNPMDAGKQRVLSIVYNKTTEDGAPRVKYELRTAGMNIALTPFNDYGVVDFNSGADFSGAAGGNGYGNYTGYQQANDAVSAITYIAFDVNPDTNEGTLSYWQNPGGNYYENARGMLFKVEKDTDGLLKGCASSGAASISFGTGVSVRRVLKEGEADDRSLKPRGYWHPFLNTEGHSVATCSTANGAIACTGTNQNNATWTASIQTPTDSSMNTKFQSFLKPNSGSLITQQCFKQNATSGVYELDPSSMDGEAAYTLIDTGIAGDLQKMVQPPNLTGVRPFEAKVKE